MGSSDNWQQVARALSSTCIVFSPDLRNHGRSFHARPHSLQAMVDDLLRLMDEEGLSTAALLGHSMGGKVAMSLALQQRQRVSKLVVVDVAMRNYSQRENQQLLEALGAVPLEDLKSRKALDEAFTTTVPDLSLRQFLLKNLARDEQNNFLWRPNLELLCSELPKYLSEVRAESPYVGPTLLIRAARSSYVQDADLESMQRAFPRLRVEAMSTAHWPHAEQPSEFVELLKAFLSEK